MKHHWLLKNVRSLYFFFANQKIQTKTGFNTDLQPPLVPVVANEIFFAPYGLEPKIFYLVHNLFATPHTQHI